MNDSSQFSPRSDSSYITDLLNFFSAQHSRRLVSDQGQLTLGGIHAELAKMPPDAEVLIQLRPGADKWGWLGEIDSYRGYYKDAMLETDGHPGSVAGFLTTIELAIGEYFTGYKGGEYYFDESTPVWADEYSLASGHMVTGVELRGDGKVYITTTQEEF